MSVLRRVRQSEGDDMTVTLSATHDHVAPPGRQLRRLRDRRPHPVDLAVEVKIRQVRD